MLTTPEPELAARAPPAARARDERQRGRRATPSRQPVIEHYLEVGFNYRMTDIQAAVGLVQLGKLDQIVARRRGSRSATRQLLADVPGCGPSRDPGYGTTNYQSFWVLLPDDFPVAPRRTARSTWREAGVSARRGIMAAHLEPAYDGCAQRPLPATERLTARTLILPLFHELTEPEQDRVVSVIATAGRYAAPTGARR